MHPNVKAIADAASVEAALPLIRCGFELETQRSEGMRWSDQDGGDADTDRMRSDAAESTQQRLSYWADLPEYLARYATGAQMSAVLAAIPVRTAAPRTWDPRNEYDWIRILSMWRRARGFLMRDTRRRAGDRLWEEFPSLRDRLESRLESDIYDDLDPSEYRSTEEDAAERLADRVGAGIEVVEDGSVAGFEFRTTGPRTVEQFREAARRVFLLDHRIDTGCSFHIHLSVVGVTHKYAAKLQHAVIAYLARNRTRAPVSVQERWADERAQRWIRVQSGNEKYSFVHWHHQGSIEFRCFGNVTNTADAEVCLQLAVEALQFGYRCLAELVPWPHEPLDILADDITGRTAQAA